ncbi:P-loop NTPase fold protein, partial [Candidatus Omnitrophota bacterium]
MKFIKDEEILLSDENDLLQTSKYADVLQKIVGDVPADYDQAFTIGLFGEWGSGKSSIVKTLQDRIEKETTKKRKIIIYDAWKYSKDSFRRMFLFEVQDKLGFEREDLMDRFYSYKAKEIGSKSKLNWSYFWLMALFAIGIAIISFNFIPVNNKNLILPVAVFMGFLSFVAVFLKNSLTELKISVEEPYIFAPEQFEDCFKHMVCESFVKTSFVKELVKSLRSLWVKGDVHVANLEQLVIVIDNIDRCHNEMAYDLLTNIKNFLGNFKNVVFVIPVDAGALKKHIIASSKKEEFSEDAEEFLRKFFNVVIRMKPLKSLDLHDFSEKLIQKYRLNFKKETLDIISKDYATNPRRIIQLFNNLQVELENSFAGIKGFEEAICKILVIKEEWPDFFKVVCGDSKVLKKKVVELEKNEVINKIFKDCPKLKAFLNKTYSFTSSVDSAIINKILFNNDSFDGLPDDLKVAIAGGTMEEVYKWLRDGQESVNETALMLLLKYLFNEMEQEIGNSRVSDSFFISLNAFLNVFDKYMQDVGAHDLNRLHNIIHLCMSNFKFEKIENYDALIKLSKELQRVKFNELKQAIIKNIQDGYKYDVDADQSDINDISQKLFLASLKIYEDDVFLNRMQHSFYQEYRHSEKRLADYEIPKKNLKVLFGEYLENYLIKEMDSNDL